MHLTLEVFPLDCFRPPSFSCQMLHALYKAQFRGEWSVGWIFTFAVPSVTSEWCPKTQVFAQGVVTKPVIAKHPFRHSFTGNQPFPLSQEAYIKGSMGFYALVAKLYPAYWVSAFCFRVKNCNFIPGLNIDISLSHFAPCSLSSIRMIPRQLNIESKAKGPPMVFEFSLCYF